MYVDGSSLRWIARHLGVVHQTVVNGVAAHANALPDTSAQPATVETAELDELYTFVGHKKPRLHRHGGRPRHGLHRGLGRLRGAHGGRDAGSG